MKKYQLRNLDNLLLEFTVRQSEDILEPDLYQITSINESTREQLPSRLNLDNIREWVEGRSIPKNREFVLDVLNSIGDINNPMRVIDVSFGLSLNDTYWITPEDFKGNFGQYNLYDNPFSEALKLVAFTGENQPIKGIETSPELTTNGMLRKCWHREEGITYLFKGGTTGFANSGLEPFSEYYAYQIGDKMGLNIVPYDLKRFKGELVSSCEMFTSKEVGYSPIWHHADITKLRNVVDIYGEERFADMVVFDAVICNTDRHYGNFGLLIDNKTREVMGPAPIFDNGLSLFCYAMEDDFRLGIEKHRSTMYNAFKIDPVTLAKEMMTGRQREMLRRLIGFKFKRHPSYNLQEWRLQKIEEFIQYRIKELLQNSGGPNVSEHDELERQLGLGGGNSVEEELARLETEIE